MAAAVATGPLRAIIYARISKEEESAGTGVESTEIQVRDARAAIEANGWILVAEPFVDKGISGAEFTKRTALQDALKFAKTRHPDVVVSRDQRRIGRDAARATHALVEFDNAGARAWWYQTHKFAELGGAEFIMTAADGYAGESERKTNNANIKRALRERAAADMSTGAIRFGYRGVTVEGARPNRNGRVPCRLEIEPDEVVILIRVGQEFVRCGTYRGAALALNAAGVKSTTGGTWNHKSVERVVTSPLYRGIVVHGETRSTYRGGTSVSAAAPEAEVFRAERPRLRIWPVELLSKIDATLARIKPRHTAPGRTKHLGSSLIRCPVCQRGMTCAGGTKGGKGYVCNRKLQHGDKGCPGIGYRSEARVNEALTRIALSLVDGPIKDRALAIVRTRLDAMERTGAREVESKRLARELAQVETEKSNLAKAVAKRGDLDALLVALDDATRRGADLRAKLARLDDAPKRLDSRRTLATIEAKLAALAEHVDVPSVLATVLRGGRLTAVPIKLQGEKRWSLRAKVQASYLLALAIPNSGTDASACYPWCDEQRGWPWLSPRLPAFARVCARPPSGG